MYRQNRNWIKRLIILAFVVGNAVALFAQSNSTQSPYSRFGLGEMEQVGSNVGRAMGSTGIALYSGNMINSVNPASYATVNAQTFLFDFATSISGAWTVEGSRRDARLLGNLEYIKMLFPTTKWMAFSLGIKPYSTVGYHYGKEVKYPDGSGRGTRMDYLGKGNLNDVYLGVGFAPFKNFSLGFNFGYLLGKISHVQGFGYNNSFTYDEEFYDILRLRGFNLECGIQYSIPIKEEKRFIIGATYSPSLAMKSTLTLDSSVKGGAKKTIVERAETSSTTAYKTPHNIGLGFAYQANKKFLYTLDGKYLLWENSFEKPQDFKPKNQWFVGAGMAYTPNIVGRSFWSRIEYRWGINVQNSYVQLRDMKSGDYKNYYRGGVSFGLGIPVADRRSFVDLTLDYRMLMPESMNMVRENYFRLTVGLRFNEGWFKKIILD